MNPQHFPCPSSYCPWCNRVRCVCPPPWWEDAQADDAYERGYAAGLADGPENTPCERWLRSPLNPRREPFPTEFIEGYRDGAARREHRVEAAYAAADKHRQADLQGRPERPAGDACDDGLPF
jgi:hypothetical protein